MKTLAELSGTITSFEGHGRGLGYPTANITTSSTLADGVYFGYAKLKNFVNHPAIIFIGVPITMGEHQRRVEAHLLDIPDVDYYGQHLVLDVYHFLRSNKHFDSIDELKRAMKRDEAQARSWFASHPELAKATKLSDTD